VTKSISLDIEDLLISVGAVNANDVRVVSSVHKDEDRPYSTIRSGKFFDATAADEVEDDGWD